MKIKHIEDIDRSLAYPGFWTQDRLNYLLAILAVTKDKIIRESDLNKITASIENIFNQAYIVLDKNNERIQFKVTKNILKECNEVIEHLQHNEWICSFFQLKDKVERPNLLIPDKELYSSLSELKQSTTEFWQAKTPTRDELGHRLLFEIMSGSGIPIERVVPILLQNEYQAKTISNTHKTTIEQPLKGYIILPITKHSSRTINIPLSSRATLLFEHFKVHPEHYSYIDYKELSFSSMNAYLNGLEAVIFSQLQRSQLPVPLPLPTKNNPVVFRYLESEFLALNPGHEYPSLIRRTREKEKQSHFNNYEIHTPLQEIDLYEKCYEEVIGWSRECLISINSVRSKLKQFLIDDQGRYQNGRLSYDQVDSVIADVFERTVERAKHRSKLNSSSIDMHLIERAIEHINQSEESTGLHIALEYIRHYLCEKNNLLNSCFNEIRNIFEYGLLCYPVIDLNSWDEEDIEIVLSEYMLDRPDKNLEETTKENIIKTFLRVVRFCHTKGVLQKIEFPHIETNGVVLTNRNHVMGLLEFDCLNKNQDPILTLAFYGGMRAGEIANLTLNDVVSFEDELTIFVRQGKTPSAKRAIPMHLIAPPAAIKCIQDHYETRSIYYRGYKKRTQRNKLETLKLNEAHLFNTKNNEFTIDSGNTVVRDSFKELQNILGDGANLHLLRHSFASMMFLRWYCCKYPDFINQLVDRQHWCFNEGIAKLREFFGESPDTPLPEHNTTAIIHLIKIMGHRRTNTFFQVYVHSFDTVLSHAIERINKTEDRTTLPGKLISEFIPNMKSRTNQRKLKSRTVKDLAETL